MALTYGDVLMNILYRIRPYEKIRGSANSLYEKWVQICLDSTEAQRKTFKEIIHTMVKEFDELEIRI